MTNIAIIEDETEHADRLGEYLQRYSAEYREPLSVKVFDNAVAFLEKYAANYDIIFMDVKMPYMNGINAAHKLREMDKDVLLFFVTSMQQYAIRGYEVDAMDYIVKPIGYFEFALKFAKAMDRLASQDKVANVVVSVETGYKKLRQADIKYVEVKNHHCVFHTADGEFRQYQSLKCVENKLDDARFVKCNNYCLVNLSYVDDIDGSSVTVSGNKLEMSRPRKKEFVKRFAEYHHGERI